MINNSYFIAILLTILAGLSTVLGGFLTFFVKRTNLKFLSIGLAFAAGVMIFLSLSEILAESKDFLALSYSEKADLIALIAFFFGMFIAFLID